MHNSYKSALALRVLFYFLRLLYIYSNPYSTRDTLQTYLIYYFWGTIMCHTFGLPGYTNSILYKVADIVNVKLEIGVCLIRQNILIAKLTENWL